MRQARFASLFLSLSLSVASVAGLSSTAALAQTAVLTQAESSQIYGLVEAANKAFMAGDADTIVNAMFEPELQAAGGAKVVRELTLEAMQQLKQNGVRIESSMVGQPGAPIAAGRYTVVLVPKAMVMVAEGKRINIQSYMIAARESGAAQWKLLDGAGFHGDMEALQKVFPGLPSGTVLPPEKNEILP